MCVRVCELEWTGKTRTAGSGPSAEAMRKYLRTRRNALSLIVGGVDSESAPCWALLFLTCSWKGLWASVGLNYIPIC